MLEAEVPAKVVQDVLGHADVTLTLNTYSHVIGSTAHEQMSKLNGLFDNKGSKPSIIRQLNDTKKESAQKAAAPKNERNRKLPER